jgi:hypothetical protein
MGLLARMGEIKNTQKSLVGKSERKRLTEGHEDGRMWSRYMLLNCDQNCAFVNTVMNFRGSNLLFSPSDTSFSRRTSLHGYHQFVISSFCSLLCSHCILLTLSV